MIRVAALADAGEDRMLVREALQARSGEPRRADEPARLARMPERLKGDPAHARTLMLQHLSASRLFAFGDRAGVLRTAQKRSGRAFRVDVRQRVVVKALVSKHAGNGPARGAALQAHVVYLGRSGAGAEGAKAEFFDRTGDRVEAASVVAEWTEDRHHFRFIISPEFGERIADLRGYAREVMRRVAADLGQPELEWVATCHWDTDQPHAHVLLRGRKPNGKDLVIARDYMAYGFRGRAQEVAQELLGDLSRADAERRIWRETQADRFTGFDRRLLRAVDADGLVADGVGGSDAWAALTRGRLRRLEALGLAERVGRRFRLDAELESRLRTLQLRQDIIRTLHQRRLEGARDVREIGANRVRGRVVRRGTHDELGGVHWVIVRDAGQVEHYARLAFGHAGPQVGRTVDLLPGPHGARVVGAERGRGLDR